VAPYVERLFGYAPRSTQEKLRVAEALEGLPAMARALESGSLNWSAVRELPRVTVPETEQAWLEVAFGKTVRQLEKLVEGKSPGDDPSSRSHSERRHVLRFEVAAETFALFREAMTELRRRADSMLDDDSALLSMARHVLGGQEDEGRSSYQIGLHVCAACGTAEQQGGGELVPVGVHIVEMARCDGQHLGYVDAPAANSNASVGGDAPVGANLEADGAHRSARAKATVMFRHADGSVYGRTASPHAIDAQAKVFSALRNLGFREREIHAVLGELLRPGLQCASVARLLGAWGR
jgi:hypothetical protein